MLSKREREILILACLPNKRIAKKLNLSVLTIQRRIVDLYDKYEIPSNVRTKAMLILEATQAGDIKSEDLRKE